jgi:hypothetical protein
VEVVEMVRVAIANWKDMMLRHLMNPWWGLTGVIHMSDQEQKQESTGAAPQTEEKKKLSSKISEEELKKVSGGSSDPQEGGERWHRWKRRAELFVSGSSHLSAADRRRTYFKRRELIVAEAAWRFWIGRLVHAALLMLVAHC